MECEEVEGRGADRPSGFLFCRVALPSLSLSLPSTTHRRAEAEDEDLLGVLDVVDLKSGERRERRVSESAAAGDSPIDALAFLLRARPRATPSRPSFLPSGASPGSRTSARWGGPGGGRPRSEKRREERERQSERRRRHEGEASAFTLRAATDCSTRPRHARGWQGRRCRDAGWVGLVAGGGQAAAAGGERRGSAIPSGPPSRLSLSPRRDPPHSTHHLAPRQQRVLHHLARAQGAGLGVSHGGRGRGVLAPGNKSEE